MALNRVEVTSEVLLTCTTHAFTTEAEEIMGLLLGDVVRDSEGRAVCKIWIAVPQVRVDRRKDRVETSPQQMAHCSEMAEHYSKATGVRTRVIGWYHSHPHITVLPSHIDVRTQATYQMLDQGFIGLIFSCFNRDNSANAENFQVTAFQSMESLPTQGSDPLHQQSLAEFDVVTQKALREAHQAEIEKSHGQWVRREVELGILASCGLPDSPLRGYLDVQQILFAEERNMFKKAVKDARVDSKAGVSSSSQAPTSSLASSALTGLHHSAVYQQALCRLLETCLAPAINVMNTQLAQNNIRMSQLQAENQKLQILLSSRQGGPQQHAGVQAMGVERVTADWARMNVTAAGQ